MGHVCTIGPNTKDLVHISSFVVNKAQHRLELSMLGSSEVHSPLAAIFEGDAKNMMLSEEGHEFGFVHMAAADEYMFHQHLHVDVFDLRHIA